MITRDQWVVSFLIRCGFPDTLSNYVGTLTWIRAEWGGATPGAKYNPLSVVMPLNGSTNFNTTGVQNFNTFDDGITATAFTLMFGDYAPIRTALAGAKNDVALIQAIAASRWGSKPSQSFLTYTYDHLTAEAALVIGPDSPVVVTTQEQFMILCPKPPLPNGRQPFAVLDIDNKRVLLFNGASLATPKLPDRAVGDYRVWDVPSNDVLLGMDRTRDPKTNEYDNRGVVIGAADGGAFQALWR